MMGVGGINHALIARVGEVTCAVPLAHVVETMRPLPVEPLGHGPGYVRGVSIIRGEPTVVIDMAALLATTSRGATRYVVVKTGGRKAALAVDDVTGIRDLSAMGELPPLARSARSEMFRAIGTLDAGLVVVLEAARLVEVA